MASAIRTVSRRVGSWSESSTSRGAFRYGAAGLKSSTAVTAGGDADGGEVEFCRIRRPIRIPTKVPPKPASRTRRVMHLFRRLESSEVSRRCTIARYYHFTGAIPVNSSSRHRRVIGSTACRHLGSAESRTHRPWPARFLRPAANRRLRAALVSEPTMHEPRALAHADEANAGIRYKRWGILGDFIYAKTSSLSSTPRGILFSSATADLEEFIGTFLLEYRPFELREARSKHASTEQRLGHYLRATEAAARCSDRAWRRRSNKAPISSMRCYEVARPRAALQLVHISS